jgi:hypothetical protein
MGMEQEVKLGSKDSATLQITLSIPQDDCKERSEKKPTF